MKDKFCEIFQSCISRPGADKLLEWLWGTDFFSAPASTRYHLSRPGGLVEHSGYAGHLFGRGGVAGIERMINKYGSI